MPEMTFQRQEAFDSMIAQLVGKIDPLDALDVMSVYVDRGMRIMMLRREKIAEEHYDGETKEYYWKVLI